MNYIKNFSRLALVLFATLATTGMASADPVVKLTGKGALELSTNGTSNFFLQGKASHLGNYICYGEVEFMPGTVVGTLVGEGVAVIQAANGDMIVGIVIWQVAADGNGQIAFSWRDSVQFSDRDETVFFSTGRFIKSRPAGAISRTKTISDGTSNIIAILIG